MSHHDRMSGTQVGTLIAHLMREQGEAVLEEFKRAVEKHGVWKTPANPDMTDAVRLPILGEEYGEVCRAMTYDEGDSDNLEAELLQVATMALAWRVGLAVARIEREGV